MSDLAHNPPYPVSSNAWPVSPPVQTPWGDTLDQTNAALIAAAPDLARLVLEKDAEIKRLRASLERMLLEYDFMVEAGLIPDTRDDVIFVEARAALEVPDAD